MGMSNGKYVKPVAAEEEEDEESRGRAGEGEDTLHEMRERRDKSREITIPQPFSSSSDLLESLPSRRPPFSPGFLSSPSTSHSSSDPTISIVFHTTVPLQHKDYFEKEWLPRMGALYDTLQGFKYRSINLLVRTEDVCEYLVIIACSDYECFLRWESTPQRMEMMEHLKSRGIVTRRLDTTSQDQVVMQSHGHPLRAYLKDPLGATSSSPPPSKWKLSVIIYLGVMMNIYLWSYTGIPVMMATAGLPKGFTLFVSLAISVPILSYSVFPLVMSIPIISRWLRAPRPEKMTSIQRLLNDGLMMFAQKGTPGTSKETIAHFKKMECRLEATRRVQHQLSNEIERMKSQMSFSLGEKSSMSKAGEDLHESTRHQVVRGIQRSLSQRGTMVKSKSTSNIASLESAPLNLNRDDIKDGDHGPITVAVAHWVKWEHILDFELWTEEITSAMAKSLLPSPQCSDFFLGIRDSSD